MNAQIVIPDFSVQTQSTTAKKSIPGLDKNKSNKTDFKDLLNTASKDTSAIDSSKSKRTYAQIVNNSKAVSVKYNNSLSNANRTETVSNEDLNDKTEDKAVNEAANNVIEGMAILMGIDSNSLKQLMTQLNINPEDLLDPAKIPDVINELSMNLELTSEQSKLLLDSVNKFSQLARQSLDNSQNKNSWVVVENVQIEVIKNDSTSSDSSTVAHLDGDIRQLANSIKKTNSTLFDSVPEKFSALLEKLMSNEKLNKEVSAKENKSEDKNEVQASEVKEVTAKSDNSHSSKNAKNDLFSAEDKSNNNILLNQVSDNANQNTQKEDFMAKLQNVSSQQRIVRNDLMRQVVEQAKVIVDENRSEMVMQLKPESLGKLTLKIVTENGIVAAKIIAENQQVRQVLETNMQTLKDSLEKQGMSVQNVSVSVGQENGQAFQQREAFERRASKGSKSKSGDTSNLAVDNEVQTNNPYELTDNSIDVIA